MKKSVITLFAIIIIAFVNFAHAQSVDEVLEKYFNAVGQDKLVKVESFYSTGKISILGMEIPFETRIKKPDMFLTTTTINGKKMIAAFDGQEGWQINSAISEEPQKLVGDQLSQLREPIDRNGELYRYQEKGSTAKLMSKENVDGKDSYRIKLTTKDGNVKDYFIDANTYLINKVKAKVSAQGQSVDIEQIMSDYKSVDGITMAMKIESKSPMGTGLIIMEDIKFNENFDDSIFKQPAK